ncbi:RDD family protein [Neobacillus citreus]|uniref:RDD family protein n=1 Tax=Neobacillus citreus TaxID=2833578 RepID=A0A942YDT0_9BACI|nr:RDD family protein [Neobacillus citreus]MCH6265564.1 RDD family protein [Neobacillus citreus]
MDILDRNVWFYIRDHQQQGPIGLFELKKLFEQGVLTGDSFLLSSDMDSWCMAKTLNVFQSTDEQDSINYALVWEEIKKDTYPTGRPFVRFLARIFDLALFTFFLIAFVSIFSPKFIVESSAITIFMICLILYILVEAAILSVFGNTLGKSLLNTRMKMVTGEPINFVTALKRSIFVTAAGMGLGVPIINIFCFVFSFLDLKNHGYATWDKQLGTIVLYGRVSTARMLVVSIIPVGLLIAGLVI